MWRLCMRLMLPDVKEAVEARQEQAPSLRSVRSHDLKHAIQKKAGHGYPEEGEHGPRGASKDSRDATEASVCLV